VFLDPPYGKGLGEAALARLKPGGWITPDALAVLEVGADEAPALPDFETLDERNYGAAKILFLRPC
jgi:16S rRNA (guanine966-N2)-methyltransferase